MTKDKLIVRQQLKIEELKLECKLAKRAFKEVELRLVSIGAPLNDNRLQFNPEQLKFLRGILEAVTG